jgi:CheY-like chemotaxis protein
MKTKRTILVIDDQPEMNLTLLGKLSEKYEVEKAISVFAVENFFDNNKQCDLIFLDIMLPFRPYTDLETKNGIETGFVLFEKCLADKSIEIIVWTRSQDALKSTRLGYPVISREKKNNDSDQLLDLANKYFEKKG